MSSKISVSETQVKREMTPAILFLFSYHVIHLVGGGQSRLAQDSNKDCSFVSLSQSLGSHSLIFCSFFLLQVEKREKNKRKKDSEEGSDEEEEGDRRASCRERV